MSVPPTIVWESGALKLLDQRRLPSEVVYLDIESVDAGIEAIRTLAVRGAPAIGIAAAYILAVAARNLPQPSFLRDLQDAGMRLKAARPTAVNLAWAVNRVCEAALASPGFDTVEAQAMAIHAEDRQICRAIGKAGIHLITQGCRVLTHCNAGALAVSELGTATAPMYLSHANGVAFSVFVDETRPLLQGARLTAWELDSAGIDVTLICDNMAASLMAENRVDLVLVGTDRDTRNGDVVNKIGTLNLAVLCRHFNVPFYVACPSSTFDPETPTGADVTIEQRGAGEVLGDSAARVPVHNPAFDVTPAALVTGLVTDLGYLSYADANPLTALLDSVAGR